MSKKFEKITLTTCIETYWPTDRKESLGMTALDELIPLIEKYCTEVTLLDYDLEGEYELVKKPEAKEVERDED
jgi:hypothetical protein